jgi:hypothetical protein
LLTSGVAKGKAHLVMKGLFHSIASLCFVIWLVGFALYDVNNKFHYWLLVAGVAAVVRILLSKIDYSRKSSGDGNDPVSESMLNKF